LAKEPEVQESQVSGAPQAEVQTSTGGVPTRRRAGSGYVLLYAAAVGLVVSTLLTAVGQLTARFRQANERAEEVRHILGVLGVEVTGKGARELVALYQARVTEEQRDGLVFYRTGGGGEEPEAYAVRFGGSGLWGPIEGFLALESDLRTVRGVSFHRQEETPGLGGEIASEKFRDQFVGKSIVGPDGETGLRVVPPGTARAANEVDAVTGATMTSARVEAMLNEVIAEIVSLVETGGEVPDE